MHTLSNTASESNIETLFSFPSQSIGDALLEKLRNMITEGVLPPGYVFPNENDFCQKLGVGRGTLRETYKALDAMGLIRRSKTGTTVNDYRTIMGSIPLTYFLKKADMNHLREFRDMIEVHGVALAAERASDLQIREIINISQLMEENCHDIEVLTAYDFKFHVALADASGNPLIKSTMMSIALELERTAHLGYQTSDEIITSSLEHHRHILEAVINRDSTAASIAMHNHITNLYAVLQKIESSRF